MPVAKSLTPRQEQVLEFIQEEIRSRGYPPTVREICQGLGLRSSSTVHAHLSQLEKKGYIRRDPTKPRAIEVLAEDDDHLIPVPIIGRVTAGEPILAVENQEGTMTLPKDFVGSGENFLLRVRGDSMIGAGILDGDLVLVRRQDTADNGDIVVALVNGEEATVKRFFREKDYIRLQPENEHLEPIITKELRVLGKVIGVLRRL
ncbi:MAG: transcriptional repressor LexA [bacterium]|nr:transcriptional repressor LexA [Bacillota bacterium]HHW54328.1 transcriptional repressor LexA [Bacillota bacterium]